MQRPRKAVIPAAGMGTRMQPATRALPKEMLPVGRQPVLQYVVEELAAAGIRQVLVITARHKNAIAEHFDDEDPSLSLAQGNGHATNRIQFFYVRQAFPRGLGHAISLAEEFVGDESFVIALGDTIIHKRSGDHHALLQRMIDAHIAHNSACTIAVNNVPREEVSKYGVVAPVGEMGPDFSIGDLIEKPSIDTAPSTFAVAARYICDARLFPALRETPPGRNNEIQLTDALRLLAQKGNPLHAVRLEDDETRYDIGNYESYFHAFVDLALADKQYGPQLREYLLERLQRVV